MVLEIDEKELDTHITFMTCITSRQGERKYRSPQPPDQLWIPYQDVLTRIPPPKSIISIPVKSTDFGGSLPIFLPSYRQPTDLPQSTDFYRFFLGSTKL